MPFRNIEPTGLFAGSGGPDHSFRLAEERPVVLPQLRRIRWAVRATLVLGVAASVVANILHALDNPISQAIAAWPPLALLLTVELISRVPVHRRSLAFARLIATATIAGIAAWVSYWHMAGVAARYGETGASPYLLPLSVDGLIVVASICLVELGARISTLETEARTARTAADAATREQAATLPAAPAQATTAPATSAPATSTQATAAQANAAQAANRFTVDLPSAAAPEVVTSDALLAEDGHPDHLPLPATARPPAPTRLGSSAHALPTARAATPHAAAPGRRRNGTTAAALAEVAAALPRTGLPKTRGAEVSAFAPTLTRQGRGTSPARNVPQAASAQSAPQATSAHSVPQAPSAAPPAKAKTAPKAAAKSARPTAPKTRRTPAETIAAAAKIKAARPDITETDLAGELGISASRWRAIRREATTNGDLRLAA
jgi:hypothetical protein